MARTLEGQLNAAGFRFALVVSRFNHLITDLVAKKVAASGQYDAVVCLGCVVRGSTPHFEYVAAEASKGIALASLETGVPIAFGVLTTDNLDQAIERAGTKAGNKGWQAALSAIEMADLLKRLQG